MPESPYFRLAEVADGTWAAISANPVHGVSNSSIVDLGGRWLVVDTFMSALAAKDLRVVVSALAGEAPVWVVNTHFHVDHVGGNDVFAGAAAIFGTDAAREGVLRAAAGIPERQATAEAAAAAVPADDPRRPNIDDRLGVLRRLRLVAPNATIGDRLTLFGDRRRAELVALGTAHTNSDLAVYLPEEATVLTGDAVVNRTIPFVIDGDAPAWLGALDRLRGFGARTLVPGHGGLGDASTIDAMEACLRALISGAQAFAASGEVPAAPEEFASWSGMERFGEMVKLVAAKSGQVPAGAA